MERRKTSRQVGDADRPFQPYLTPPEIAKLLGVSQSKVLGWIRRGELKAVNVSNRDRPRYRVHQKAWMHFLKAREVQPPPERTRRRPLPPEGGPIDPALGKRLLRKKEAVKIDGMFYRVRDGIILRY
jgi:excisionase family DNA binding protein